VQVGLRIEENPFYVLGLPPTASRAEIEREGQKLLGLIELGLKQASAYETPLGARPRTAEQVRWALSELRDPARRLVHELWAAHKAAAPPAAASEPPAAWPEVVVALGWSPRR
jgi:hypothetical protein